jgi:anti-anti-sigma regulatory factor
MLRIQRTADRTITVLTVSGRLDAANTSELHQSLDVLPAGEAVVLDLADLVLADRVAVRFLRDREACGRIVLRNCPAYIRRWMEGEETAKEFGEQNAGTPETLGGPVQSRCRDE